jgi:hypothetical protein
MNTPPAVEPAIDKRLQRTRRAAGRFFVRIGQTSRATEPRDPFTIPLFPLWLLMDAEGLLANDALRVCGAEVPR